MSDGSQVTFVVGSATGAGASSGSGYSEAGGKAAGRALHALGDETGAQMIATIAAVARQLEHADLPPHIEQVKISLGLVISADFGVSIAGMGVEGDVNVEISWRPGGISSQGGREGAD